MNDFIKTDVWWSNDFSMITNLVDTPVSSFRLLLGFFSFFSLFSLFALIHDSFVYLLFQTLCCIYSVVISSCLLIHGRRGLGITCVRSYCLIYHNKILFHYTVYYDNLGFVLQCFNYISKGLAIFSREVGVTKFFNRIQE